MRFFNIRLSFDSKIMIPPINKNTFPKSKFMAKMNCECLRQSRRIKTMKFVSNKFNWNLVLAYYF